MKWEKRGLIFSPQNYGLEYAKSPQVLPFKDFIRIYFSACKTDGNKLISYVCFADFSKDLKEVLHLSKQVIPDGDLGCFDEHGIFPFSPFENGNEVWAYISGWSRRVSVSVETGIGLAQSYDNGQTFQRVGNGPILSSSIDEPFLVMDGFVRKFLNTFHMWYIFGTDWKKFAGQKEPDRIYRIGHAISDDGITWKRDGIPIIPGIVREESQALPCVIYYSGVYRMFFCYRHSYDFRRNSDHAYRLGYAYSYDLRNWKRDDLSLNFQISSTGWDSQMQCYPHVFEQGNKLYMLYNGNEFGKYGFGLAELEEL